MGFQEYFTVEVTPLEGVPEAMAALVVVKDWEWQREDVHDLVAFLEQLSVSRRHRQWCYRTLREQQQGKDRVEGVMVGFLQPAANYPGMTLNFHERGWRMEPATQSRERAMASA